MLYLLGESKRSSAVTDNHEYDGKTEKRRTSRRNSTSETQNNQFEPVVKHHHRRKHRHSSTSRCMSKKNSISNNIEESHDYSFSSPKHKQRRCKTAKGPVRFIDELMRPASTSESGFMEDFSELEIQLVKYKNKYGKLDRNYKEVQSQNLKLQTSITQQDGEYKELQTHYEQLLKHMQSMEEERITNQNSYKKLSAENVQLNEDLSLLKILIYKLNVELERYQDKLRLCNQKNGHVNSISDLNEVKNDVEPEIENKRITEAWGRVNTHVLSPLLEAYKENIEEKEELIGQFRRDIDHFSDKSKEITAENDELRKDLDYHKAQCGKLEIEIKTLLDDTALIKKENDILSNQAALQKHKLLDIHSMYEKKVESMSQDNNKLHTEYVNCRTELSNLQGKYEILNDGYEKLKKNSERTMPVSVHSDAIEECKRLFEELKTQYDTEKRKLLSQLKRLEESNPEYEKQIAALTAERDHFKILTKNLDKNLKRTQHKLKSNQNALLSTQVSCDSFKRQLSKTTLYCQQLVTEQEKLQSEKGELLTRFKKKTKENESIQFIGDNIAMRMGALKDQLKSVQKGAKEQLDTVEKQIKIKEMSAGKMKSDYEQELQRLKHLIKEKEDVIGKLQREKITTQDNLELVWKAATNEKTKKAL